MVFQMSEGTVSLSILKTNRVMWEMAKCAVMELVRDWYGDPPAVKKSKSQSGAAMMSGTGMTGAAVMTEDMESDDLSIDDGFGFDLSEEEMEELLADELEDIVSGNLFTTETWSQFPPEVAEIEEQEEINSRLEIPLRAELPSTSSRIRRE